MTRRSSLRLLVGACILAATGAAVADAFAETPSCSPALVETAAELAGTSAAVADTPAEAPSCSLALVETAPGQVIAPCSKIIDDASTSPADRGRALFTRGKGYHNTKRFNLARQDYDAAIPLTPTNEELFASRANIAFRARRWQEGVKFLQQALKLNPSNAHVLRMVGSQLEMSGDREQAHHYYTLALQSDPNEAYALLFRSKNSVRRLQFDEALKDADALVAMAPAAINRQGYLDCKGDRLDFHIIALDHRADVHDALGRPDRAEQDLTAAITYSRSALSLAARGKYLAYKRGRDQDAASDLDEAISLGSDDSRAFHARGMVYVLRRQYEPAFAAFDRALKLDPHFASALRMRARMYREFDKTELAVADMRDAVMNSPAVLEETMPALMKAGYWRSREVPNEMTPALEDAIRACMLDKTCN
ncbi:tetratricopeptide repeat protein [Bradyrhizobium sp. CB3481]|uniref:tetratricopeptide repeat protein n=1 Tax=Bradyrhizobium sp. CB3481 TaxID=3039158 RepID=UPI0024B2800D|nr:tetratricopeptide repeat protein [Bradyrhizobium sp. CB3481]WFU15876.1 tetratricopeptide repeat protein [Bradyrhizobium sp. CB3481]